MISLTVWQGPHTMARMPDGLPRHGFLPDIPKRVAAVACLFYHVSCEMPTSSATPLCTFLAFLTLLVHDLDPHDLLDHPNIPCLALHHTFQVLQAVAQILDLALIEVLRIRNFLLHEESCSNVD
jgi:hypothetical protein